MALGIRREDRHGHSLRGLYHPAIGLGGEVVSGELFDGRTDKRRLVVIDLQSEHAVIPPVEDMVADRMGQYSASPRNRSDMLEQAVALFVLAEGTDTAYLDHRVREETDGEFGANFLKDQADARTNHHD